MTVEGAFTYPADDYTIVVKYEFTNGVVVITSIKNDRGQVLSISPRLQKILNQKAEEHCKQA